MNKTLHVIDGYGIIYQSYFAFINRPLYNPEGKNSQAVFGFFRTLFEYLREQSPDYCVIVMDSKTKTFRHEKYPEYKANRDATPEELHDQVGVIEEILSAMNMPFFRVDGYEADDLIAALSAECKKKNFQCRIVSRDKDVLQLVDENTTVFRSMPKQSGYETWDRTKVFEEIGVYPEQMIDYLALTGDQSDNVPGISGVGPKTAVKLLREYHTLESVFEQTDAIKGSLHDKIVSGRENAFLSRELVTLAYDAALPDDIESFSTAPLETAAALPLFEKQGMKSIVQSFSNDSSGTPSDTAPVTGTSVSADTASAAKPVLSETAPGTYTTITDIAKLEQIVDTIKSQQYFSYDTETDSTNEMEAEIIGMSIALGIKDAYYIPVRSEGTACLSLETVFSILNPVFQDPKILLIGQNIKYDYKVIKRAGITVNNALFDTMIAAWLLDSDGQRSFNVDDLAE